MSYKLWGGRFSGQTDPQFKKFNDSFSFDVELLQQELHASAAWASALADAGVLTPDEEMQLLAALTEVGGEAVETAQLAAGAGLFEDVHSFVEGSLAQKVGELAGKLHTGRSRNDQVATDLRLYLKTAVAEAHDLVLDLASSLAIAAENDAATAMPGYTHLKQAEPVTFGHWCLAYVEMLLRDADRLGAALDRADECPLGSAALAGTPVRVDRAALAASLGFARPTANSLDAVSDRDAAADYVYSMSMLFVHLSRFAEDIIFYSADEVGMIELPDELATGSSRMPQKKNPDLLELTRGHAARAIGELTAILSLLKGLPLAYNKDLQLDKEPIFRLRTTAAAALPALTRLVSTWKINREVMREAASSDLLLATQRADAIAATGVPFRKAHELVSRRVVEGTATASELTVDDALAAKDVIGGTAPSRVREAARVALARIAKARL